MFVKRPLGTLVHYPNYVWHAMKTEAQPLLTVYAWVGDLFEMRVIMNGL